MGASPSQLFTATIPAKNNNHCLTWCLSIIAITIIIIVIIIIIIMLATYVRFDVVDTLCINSTRYRSTLLLKNKKINFFGLRKKKNNWKKILSSRRYGCDDRSWKNLKKKNDIVLNLFAVEYINLKALQFSLIYSYTRQISPLTLRCLLVCCVDHQKKTLPPPFSWKNTFFRSYIYIYIYTYIVTRSPYPLAGPGERPRGGAQRYDVASEVSFGPL